MILNKANKCLRQAIFYCVFLVAGACNENSNGTDIYSPAVKQGADALAKDSGLNQAEVKSPNTVKHLAFKQDVEDLSLSLMTFVPGGYHVLDTSAGDLNLDQFPDLIMVLRKEGEDSSSSVTEHPEKRPLLILAGQADGGYKLSARNDNAVYCIDCGGIMGDPFMDVAIKKGQFSVDHYAGSAWRWTREISFKYSIAEKNWLLHEDRSTSFHVDEPEKETVKIKTIKNFGEVPFEKFDIYKTD